MRKRTRSGSRNVKFLGLILASILVVGACSGDDTADTTTATTAATTAASTTTQPGSDATTTTSPPETTTTTQPRTRTRLVIAFAGRTTDEAHAFYTSVPETMGWFAEEGVSVDVLNTAGGTEAVQLMIGGDADVSVTGPSTIFSSRQAGEPVIGVASTVQQLHLYPAVLADSPIQSVADFKGAVIGIPSLGTSLLPPLKAQIREAGLDPDADVEYVATGGAASTLAAYQSGDIDVLGLFDIAYALLEVDGYELRIFNDVNESPFLGTLAMGQGVITNADWVAANADTLVGFLRAMVKGEIFAKENPECAVRFHWSLFPESVPAGLDESDAFAQGLAKVRQRSTGQFADASGNWAMMVPEVMQNWHDFLLENGEIATAQDVANAWTNQYIEEANNFDKEAVAELARNTSC